MTRTYSVDLTEQEHSDFAHAIRQWIQFGEQSLGKAHQGVFAGSGWDAVQLRALLEKLQAAPMSAKKLSDMEWLHSHAVAIGMHESADIFNEPPGQTARDIALFITRLSDALDACFGVLSGVELSKSALIDALKQGIAAKARGAK